MGFLRKMQRRAERVDPAGPVIIGKLRQALAKVLTEFLRSGVSAGDARDALVFFAAHLAHDGGQSESDFAKTATNAYVSARRDNQSDDEEDPE